MTQLNLKPRIATSAIHGARMPEHEPVQRQAARERMRLERAREVKALAKLRRRINKRQGIGSDWDGRAANDNIAWPLATALIREGKELEAIGMAVLQMTTSLGRGNSPDQGRQYRPSKIRNDVSPHLHCSKKQCATGRGNCDAGRRNGS